MVSRASLSNQCRCSILGKRETALRRLVQTYIDGWALPGFISPRRRLIPGPDETARCHTFVIRREPRDKRRPRPARGGGISVRAITQNSTCGSSKEINMSTRLPFYIQNTRHIFHECHLTAPAVL